MRVGPQRIVVTDWCSRMRLRYRSMRVADAFGLETFAMVERGGQLSPLYFDPPNTLYAQGRALQRRVRNALLQSKD